MLSALDRKLFRDLLHIWPQALAIAMVLASGVATFILAVGAYRSLQETRSAYYERYRFADVFASATRAPKALETEIAAIPGVIAAEARIEKLALLDIEGMLEPATGIALSLPDYHAPRLNRIYLRQGRLPEPGNTSEVTVDEAFAKAHGYGIGSRFKAVLNGRKRDLRIVGLALSPEFIYAIGPGDLMPDPRRFGVLWMSEKALAAIFDLDGAFNFISVSLLRGASEAAVISAIDRLLDRHGGTGAYGRTDQISHEFLDAELKQLSAMARIIPPIFLFVSAFLLNMILTRLIALEREQIGLLKALGYDSLAIGIHYLKMVLAIAALGIFIGSLLGTWFGTGITEMYGRFFQFPFLIFRRDPDVYLLAAGVATIAASAGAIRGIWQALELAPAIAMQPPAPPRFSHSWLERLGIFAVLSQMTVIGLRNMLRSPVRAAFTALGIALSVALLVVSLFALDSIEFMIDVTFFRSDRQQASITFVDKRAESTLHAVARLPGVLRAEPWRSVSVRLLNGTRSRKVAITGKPPRGELSRVLDLTLSPVALPEQGLVISRRLADILALRRGDTVAIELLEGRRGTYRAVVSDVIQQYFGLGAYMDLAALNAMLDDPPLVSGAHIAFDNSSESSLFAAIKATPAIAGIALQRVSLRRFRETLRENINIMTSIYISLSVIIAFGVVYNSARVQLSERGRELASLRVLGFTRGEVTRILLTELAILVLLAQPLGWVLGYGFGWLVIQGFSSDLYTAPFIIETSTYARASLVALASAAASAVLIRRRVDTLDLIEVLKTRE